MISRFKMDSTEPNNQNNNFQSKNEFVVHPIPVLADNIIWIWVVGAKAIVVDPSISDPVIKWLKKRNICVTGILQTHHHEDHTGGTIGLLKEWPEADVIASKDDLSRIPLQTTSVKDNDILNLLGYQVKAIEVPGHTINHIAFFITDPGKEKIPILFPGDTLFAAGCGRLFEGSPQQMFESLRKLNNLPSSTKVYSAHEYTESNLEWSLSINPQDKKLYSKLKEIKIKLRENLTSLPTTIEEERQTNLFIQAKSVKEFSFLRQNKDNWQS